MTTDNISRSDIAQLLRLLRSGAEMAAEPLAEFARARHLFDDLDIDEEKYPLFSELRERLHNVGGRGYYLVDDIGEVEDLIGDILEAPTKHLPRTARLVEAKARAASPPDTEVTSPLAQVLRKELLRHGN